MEIKQPVGIAFSSAEVSVVAFVRNTCPYCTASLPFYDRIRQSLRGSSGQFIVISPDPPDATRQYLSLNHLDPSQFLVSAVRSADYPFLVSTPTLLVVDRTGHLKNGWRGQLDEAKQQEVADSLGLPVSQLR